MTQLSGSLEGIGLVALLEFLTSVGTTGRLAIFEGDLHGRLELDRGALVGAVLGHEQGLPALEAIALALGGARFQLIEMNDEPERNLALSREDLAEELEQLMRERTRIAAAIPSLASVARPALVEDEGPETVLLERDVLRLLVKLDGQRTVAQIAEHEGLTRTLRTLVKLVELQLARVEAPPAASASSPPTMQPEAARTRPMSPRAAPPQASGERPPQPAWSRWRRPSGNAG